MFRGIAFMVNAGCALTVGTDRIMCRVDPALNDSLASRPGAETMVMNGRTYRGYIRVAESAVRTEKQLAEWIGLALEFNDRAKRSAKRPAKTSRPNSRAS